jgi:raffinose/stachyose/melibiose transport system permease protein
MEKVSIRESLLGSASALRRRRSLTVFLFLLPSSILFILFVIMPVIRAFSTSLFKWNGLGPLDNFIGLGNYERLLSKGPFMEALGHNLVIIALSLGIQLPLSLALALLVGRKLPGRTAFRTIFFLPYVVAPPITAYLWRLMLNPRFSMINFINDLLAGMLPGFEPGSWLGDPKRVLMAIFLVLTWQYFGLHMVLFVAGLQQIPEEIEEAARIDGANSFQNLRYIVIPMLANTIYMGIYLSVLGSLQQFALVWIMTEGGPVGASELVATHMYRGAFVSFQLGYGSAVAFTLFIICLIFSLVYQRIFMRDERVGRIA